MKKQSIFISLLLVFCVAQTMRAMSPGQIQSKIRDFNTLLGEYREKVTAGQIMTPEARGLKAQAEAILKEIRPYTTVAVFESQLQAAEIRGQESQIQAAALQFDRLATFFGRRDRVGTLPSRDLLKARGAGYYEIIANKLMEQGYDLLARMYPQGSGRLTEVSIGDFLVLSRNKDYETLVEIALEQGGALYWMNRNVARTFNILNIFANYDAGTANLYDSFNDLGNKAGELIKMVYSGGDNNAVYMGGKKYDIAKNDFNGFAYNIKALANTNLFPQLMNDLNSYDIFINFATGYRKLGVDYNANSRDAIISINKAISKYGNDIPGAEQSIDVVLEAVYQKGREVIFQVTEKNIESLSGKINKVLAYLAANTQEMRASKDEGRIYRSSQITSYFKPFKDRIPEANEGLVTALQELVDMLTK